jgi:glycosylphosphatidylinositol transamidase (GPIT) subunit GPI8
VLVGKLRRIHWKCGNSETQNQKQEAEPQRDKIDGSEIEKNEVKKCEIEQNETESLATTSTVNDLQKLARPDANTNVTKRNTAPIFRVVVNIGLRNVSGVKK